MDNTPTQADAPTMVARAKSLTPGQLATIGEEQVQRATLIQASCVRLTANRSQKWADMLGEALGALAVTLKGEHPIQLDRCVRALEPLTLEELDRYLAHGHRPGAFLAGVLDGNLDAAMTSPSVEIWQMPRWHRAVTMLGVARDRRLWEQLHQFHRAAGAHSVTDTARQLREVI